MTTSTQSLSAPSCEIETIRFRIANDQDNEKQSVMAVTSCELLVGGQPVSGSLFDTRLGTTDYAFRCNTCDESQKTCLCHYGHIKMKTDVINPMVIDDVRKWLKITCVACGAPLFDWERAGKFPLHHRLTDVAAVTSNEGKTCPRCNEIQPRIIKDETDFVTFRYQPMKDAAMRDVPLRDLRGERLEALPMMFPFQIKIIFDRIENKTVERLGRAVISHPRNFILRTLIVPPVSIRPSSKIVTFASGPLDHDITNGMQAIFRQNNQLPDVIAEPVSAEVTTMIQGIQTMYHSVIQGASPESTKRTIQIGTSPTPAILQKLPGKSGRLRYNLLGKRVLNIGRATIAGNPALTVDEIGIPKMFARILQIEETVREYNLAYLMSFFQNGKTKYPGCSKVWKKSNGSMHTIDFIKADFSLEPGDVIYRDLVTGDITYFNRQPTLERSSIGVHRVVVLEGDNNNTIQFNVMSCVWYNADFNHRSSTGGHCLGCCTTQACNGVMYGLNCI
jgi:DNA-directed RNA polymerase beta' subunit